MICYLSHSEIDKEQWNETVSHCGNIYAYAWYLDIVHPDWAALVEDDYATIMPLTGGRKFGIDYLFQPFFVQQLGVFSQQSLNTETVNSFLDVIPAKYRFAEIRLNETNCECVDAQRVEFHRNVILDLNKDYDALRGAYHTNTKRNLAKAESHRLQLMTDVNPVQVIDLFRNDRGASLDKWGDKEYKVLQRLTEEAVRRGNAFVVGVSEARSLSEVEVRSLSEVEARSLSEVEAPQRSSGVGPPAPLRDLDVLNLLAGAIFMKTDCRVTFLFSGNSIEGKEKQAMSFMLDQVIRKYAGQDIVFDFEGSDNDQLARYYLGFGGKEVKYPSLAFNRLSGIGKLLLKCWKKAK